MGVNDLLSLKGRVALVTGGRRGLGEAIALVFAEAGADVAVCDIVVDTGELDAVAEKIMKLGRRSLAVQADVAKKADVDNMVNKVSKELGGIDVLVNNAGGGKGGEFLELTEESWDFTVDLVLKGTFLCSQAVARGMVERKRGSIVNISSIEGVRAGGHRVSPYGCAKAGVLLLTRQLAWELGKFNIRANAITPGGMKTQMVNWNTPEAAKWLGERTAIHPFGDPREVANVALFLACDASSFVTGITVAADGGYLA